MKKKGKRNYPATWRYRSRPWPIFFMILLVFLLKSYSSSISNISPIKRTKLPVASSQDILRDSLKLEISQDSILIDEKPVVYLNNFEFLPGQSPESGYSGPVYKVLAEQRKKWPDPNIDPHLLVLADEMTPYSTIKGVLSSAATSGFVDLQLVVVQNN